VGHNAEINNDFIGSDRVLMKGYLDTSGGVLDTSIIVSGLGPEFSGGYDVYVYALSSVGSDGRGGRYSIGSIIKFGDTGNNGPPDVNGPLYVEDPGVDHLDKGNYLVFHGITGDSFTLIAHPEVPLAGPKRASVNGVQIVAIPDPGCLLWLTVGGCLLFAHRRLRR
jgi:hypothetical protein